MTAHKHAAMIKAKADNMDLVVFQKTAFGEWVLSSQDTLPCFEDVEYFLCLPQHKESCLHWLNGGDAEYFHDKFQHAGWIGISDSLDSEWTSEHTFMDFRYVIRIKPKKGKRLVVIHGNSLVNKLFKFDADIRAAYGSEYSALQIFEIEVEV